LALERAQQAAQIARVEAERVAQRAHIGTADARLENQPRLAQWPAAAEVAPLERADALRDEAVEAADLLNLKGIYYLTLVREFEFAILEADGPRHAP
jgi:hypothetical protein